MDCSLPQCNLSNSINSKESSIQIEEPINDIQLQSNNNRARRKKIFKQPYSNIQSLEQLSGLREQNLGERKNSQDIKIVRKDEKNGENIVQKGLPICSNRQLVEPAKIKITYQSPPLVEKKIWKNTAQLQTKVEQPSPIVWIEKRPYSRQVIDFEQRIVYVPVQKIETGEYEIEHIIEYIKRAVTEVKPILEARQKTSYKLQYVPVESKIIHFPSRCVSPPLNPLGTIHQQPERQEMTSTNQFNQYFCSDRPKFVTSSNYNYELRAKEIQLLSEKMEMLKQKEKQLRTPL